MCSLTRKSFVSGESIARQVFLCFIKNNVNFAVMGFSSWCIYSIIHAQAHCVRSAKSPFPCTIATPRLRQPARQSSSKSCGLIVMYGPSAAQRVQQLRQFRLCDSVFLPAALRSPHHGSDSLLVRPSHVSVSFNFPPPKKLKNQIKYCSVFPKD